MVKKIFALFWKLAQEKPQDHAYYDALLPRVPFYPERGIERCIHHIYHSQELPKSMADNAEYLRSINLGYDYQLWDFDMLEGFIKQYYGQEVFDIYRKIRPEYVAAKSDLCRYLLIYKLGGVYLDVKSSLNRPLSEVIRQGDSCILSHWDNLPGQEHEGWTTQHPGLEELPRGEYVQWYLAYSSGHPLLREIIVEVLRRIDSYNPFVNSVGRGGVLSTTGPIPYSLTVLKFRQGDEEKHQIRIEELPNLGFVYSIYDTKQVLHLHKKIMPSNYWILTSPLISSSSRFIQFVSVFFLKIWYWYLDLKWRLLGKSGYRL